MSRVLTSLDALDTLEIVQGGSRVRASTYKERYKAHSLTERGNTSIEGDQKSTKEMDSYHQRGKRFHYYVDVKACLGCYKVATRGSQVNQIDGTSRSDTSRRNYPEIPPTIPTVPRALTISSRYCRNSGRQVSILLPRVLRVPRISKTGPVII